MQNSPTRRISLKWDLGIARNSSLEKSVHIRWEIPIVSEWEIPIVSEWEIPIVSEWEIHIVSVWEISKFNVQTPTEITL